MSSTIDDLHTKSGGRWDLGDLFGNDAEWSAALDGLTVDLVEADTFRGRLANAQVLLEYLEWDNAFTARYLRLQRYAMFKRLAEGDNLATADLDARIKAFWRHWANVCDFGDTELRRLSDDAWGAMLEQKPDLEGYRTYVERLRHTAPRALSEVEERLLGQLSGALDLARRTSDLLASEIRPLEVTAADGIALVVNPERLGILYRHPEQAVRQQARRNAINALRVHRGTFAHTLHMSVARLIGLARVRGYKSTLMAALEPDELGEDTFHAVIAAFDRNLNVWQKVFRARASLLGRETLAPYDLQAGIDAPVPKVEYATAVEWICSALAPMGQAYVDVLRDGMTNGHWVRWSADGREVATDMAYPTYGAKPRVQLHYDGSIRGVSLLAHELGHAMHYWHFGRAQPFHYARTTRLVSEGVANFHQAMLRAWLLSNYPQREYQRAVIDEELGFFLNYYFTKPVMSKIEYAIHQRVWDGRAISPDWLDETTESIYREAFGSAVESDELVASYWIGATSLENNFYNFQYLPGFALGAALAAGLLDDRIRPAQVTALLEAGTSLDPSKSVALTGFNLSDSALLDSGFATLSERASRLEWNT
jgi:oligoendopeptidase F